MNYDDVCAFEHLQSALVEDDASLAFLLSNCNEIDANWVLAPTTWSVLNPKPSGCKFHFEILDRSALFRDHKLASSVEADPGNCNEVVELALDVIGFDEHADVVVSRCSGLNQVS
jgi:hypothetical protein